MKPKFAFYFRDVYLYLFGIFHTLNGFNRGLITILILECVSQHRKKQGGTKMKENPKWKDIEKKHTEIRAKNQLCSLKLSPEGFKEMQNVVDGHTDEGIRKTLEMLDTIIQVLDSYLENPK